MNRRALALAFQPTGDQGRNRKGLLPNSPRRIRQQPMVGTLYIAPWSNGRTLGLLPGRSWFESRRGIRSVGPALLKRQPRINYPGIGPLSYDRSSQHSKFCPDFPEWGMGQSRINMDWPHHQNDQAMVVSIFARAASVMRGSSQQAPPASLWIDPYPTALVAEFHSHDRNTRLVIGVGFPFFVHASLPSMRLVIVVTDDGPLRASLPAQFPT
jgi:hypothetical protein